jgi:hypothetical protein
MGISWQDKDHRAFFNEHLASYVLHRDKNKLKEFWTTMFEQWLERWPLTDPPAEFVEKVGSVAGAEKAWRTKKLDVSVIQPACLRRALTPSTAG